MSYTAADLPPRLTEKVEVQADGCWLWTASTERDGYGRVSFKGTRHPAHRLTYWLLAGGPLPQVLHHTCRCRACVNPAHLEATTLAKHPDAGPAVNRAKTECPRGHPYSPENTYIDRNGGRSCCTCTREHTRQWHRRREAAAPAEHPSAPTRRRSTTQPAANQAAEGGSNHESSKNTLTSQGAAEAD